MNPPHCRLRARNRICGFIVLLGMATAACAAQADAADDYVRDRMDREHIPGLSLAVIRDGKVVKERGYGFANLELEVRANADTVYELASTTKPLMATAILLLVQDGKMSLDDSVGKYIEGAPPSWKGITVRHLLSHSSGVKDYLSDLRKDFPHDTPPEQIVKAAMEAPLNFAPGEKWRYSNTGYVLLGMIVRKVSGVTYDALLRERLFKPFGMTSTRRDTPDEVVPMRASGYLWFGGAYHNGEFLKYLMTNHGDRGILSSVRDLEKWDAALSGTDLLNPALKKLMWTPIIRADAGSSEETDYGLGWFVRRINSHLQISHPGGAPGTGAIISRYQDDHLTVIVLANCENAFMQELDRGIAAHYIVGLRRSSAVRLSPSLLESCEGYYNAYGSQLLTVTCSRSVLALDDGGGLNNDFLPESEREFVAEEADRAFVVTRGSHGEVTGATLRLGKDKLPVQRIGPLCRALRPVPDPDPARTARIEAILKAFAQGGKAVLDVPQLAPQARSDYSHGPDLSLNGIRSLSYIGEADVSAQQIDRHGAKVSRVLYCRLATDRDSKFVLVYLTADGLVTDQDVARW